MKPLLFVAIALMMSCKKESTATSINQQVSSNSVRHENSEVSYTVDVETYSECSKEFVHIAGEIQLTYREILKDDGGYHIVARDRAVNIRGVGVTSGRRYIYQGRYNKEHTFEGEAGVYKVTAGYTLMTPGGGGNSLIYHNTVTFVTNANGELKVTNTVERVSCH